MDTIKKVLKSRTTWTLVALIAVNVIPAVSNLIPGQFLPLANAILGLAVLFFKFNPSQYYGNGK